MVPYKEEVKHNEHSSSWPSALLIVTSSDFEDETKSSNTEDSEFTPPTTPTTPAEMTFPTIPTPPNGIPFPSASASGDATSRFDLPSTEPSPSSSATDTATAIQQDLDPTTSTMPSDSRYTGKWGSRPTMPPWVDDSYPRINNEDKPAPSTVVPAVLVPLFVFAVAGAFLLVWLRRRKRRRQAGAILPQM